MNTDTNILYMNVENIIPNRFQPRIKFDETALKELATSIKEHGIIQPLVVRKLLNGKYEIIAGERRFKASQIAGLEKVPVIVTELDDNASAEVALIENLQRKDLSAIEEAKSYKKLLDRGYLTQEELASKLGVSQSNVANKVRLLNLTEEVQDALMRELISERHARSLLQITNPTDQINMLNKIIEKRLTVRQLDTEINNLLNKNVESLDIIDIKEQPTIEEEKNDIEMLDFNIDNEKEIEEVTKAINDSKKELDREYEIFDIPFGEEVVEEKQEEEPNKIEKGNISSVINKIKDIEKSAKEAGFEIETEDYDFEDLYQIIIKIEK